VAARDLADFRSGNAGIPNWGVENVYGLVVQEKFLPASVYVTTFIEDDFLQRAAVRPQQAVDQVRAAVLRASGAGRVRLVQVLHRHAGDQPARARRRARRGQVARAAAKLKEMDAFLKARGYRHLIFISPTRPQVLGERPRDARVKAELEKQGVPVVYLLDKPRVRAASAQEKRAWYHDIDHLTRQAMRCGAS